MKRISFWGVLVGSVIVLCNNSDVGEQTNRDVQAVCKELVAWFDIASDAPLYGDLLAAQDKEHIVESLKKYKVHLTLKKTDGMTLLHQAVYKDLILLVEILIELNMPLDGVDDFERTALHLTAGWGVSEQIARALLAHGASVDVQDDAGCTPLFMALSEKNIELVELLLEYKAAIHISDNSGVTPLHMAARRGCYIIAQRLIACGAKINAVDTIDKTPLFESLEHDHYRVTQLLIEHGAHLNTSDHWGDTPLHKAASSQNKEAVRLLLKHHANVHTPNLFGSTPLHNATINGNKAIVIMLLDAGADIDCQSIDIRRTPLHCAVVNGHYDIVHLLLESGADFRIYDAMYGQAIHAAAAEGYELIVKLLLEYGSSVNIPMQGGSTPLHEAVRYAIVPDIYGRELMKHDAVVDVLLAAGADATLKDDEGNTPLDIAFSLLQRRDESRPDDLFQEDQATCKRIIYRLKEMVH